MEKTTFMPLFAALMLTAMASTANANVISMSPFGQVAGQGEQVSFDIHMDFLDNTVGGAFDVFYNASLLSFVAFEYDIDFLASVADPDFATTPDNCLTNGAAISGCSVGDAEINGIGFGSFDGITGSHRIGTITFETIAPGTAVLMMATNDGPWEGFYSSVDASELTVLYGPAKVQVVPLPAAVWLFASGLLGLAGLSRKRTR